MGKMYKEFEVPSRQAGKHQMFTKRRWKRAQVRKTRYESFTGEQPDSLANRLKAFFMLNPGLTWTEITFFKCLAEGALKRNDWNLSRAHVGYGREFPVFCWSLYQEKAWNSPKSLWLLGVSEAAFDFERDYVHDQVRH